MNATRPDAVTPFETETPRREAVLTLGALGAALLGGLGLGAAAEAKNRRKTRKKRRKARKANADAAGVEFFERMAVTLQVSGDCNALAQAVTAFQQEHAAELDAVRSREQQWDVGTRERVSSQYQERITRATETLHTLMAACRFRGGSEAAICAAPGTTPGGDQGPLPAAAQCSGCDCSCICPISAGECTWSFFSCLGGSHAACCWFGACAGHICNEQCPNCCNCGLDCCGC